MLHYTVKILYFLIFYYKHSNFKTKRFYHGMLPPNDANGIANSEDPDQAAPRDLGMYCLPDLSVQKLW